MIDWLTCKIAVNLPAPIANRWTVKVRADGIEERRTPHGLPVAGSFESSLMIRAVRPEELELSGNVAKFLQGHNLYGPDDPTELLWAALQRLEPHLGAKLPQIGLTSPSELARRTAVTRVDCTEMLQFETFGDVHAFLRSAEATGRIPRRGRGVFDSGTLVFGHAKGKSRTRWQIVLYSKGQEVTAHPLPPVMTQERDVLEWVNRCLRVEIRLFRNELRERDLRSLARWESRTAAMMWREKVEQLSFNEVFVDDIGDLSKLPDHLRGTYAQWKLGHDLRSSMTKAKFYRHRRLIESLTGVDISIAPASSALPSVVPIKRVLEAGIVRRPAWSNRVDQQLHDAGCVVFRSAA